MNLAQGKSLPLWDAFVSSPSCAVEQLKKADFYFCVWNTALHPRHHTISVYTIKKMVHYKLQSGSGGHFESLYYFHHD
jgi:hypothetical protein